MSVLPRATTLFSYANPLAKRHCGKDIPGASLVPRAQVADLELEGLRLVDVTLRASGLDIQVVHRVLVKGLGPLAGKNVRKAGRVSEAEYAPSARNC